MAWKRDVMPKDILFRKAHHAILDVGDRAKEALPMFDVPQGEDDIAKIRSKILGFSNELGNLILLSPPGMNAYGQDQFGDPGFNTATEFAAVKAAIDAVIVEIDALPDIPFRDSYSPATMANVQGAMITMILSTGLTVP
jgi:hypothetical protein